MRRGAVAVLLAALFGVLLIAPRPVRAQEAELQHVLDSIAASWAQGDAADVIKYAVRSGISLDMKEGAVGPLPARQAVAMLRRFFTEFETVSVRPSEAEVTGGRPEQGYGELSWVVRAHGATVPELARVFIALVKENGAWRVTQIRLMP